MLALIGRQLADSVSRAAAGRTLAGAVASYSHSQQRSTTILCVRKGPDVVLAGDGMASLGGQVVKPNVKKLRQLRPNVIGGFAGATADAFTLFEKLENKLDEHQVSFGDVFSVSSLLHIRVVDYKLGKASRAHFRLC